MSGPLATSWRAAQAEVAEVQADTCDAALVSLKRLRGMFRDGCELDNYITYTINLLAVEESNLRKRAEKLREEAQQ